jgi:uncharacterized membrane protein
MRVLLQQAWVLWLLPLAAFAGIVFTMSPIELATDWFSAEGDAVLLWWLCATLAGVAVFPLVYRLLPTLADRGYGLARLAGLLLVGFVFWFLASIGLLQNTPGAVTTAWVLVLGVSALAWFNWESRPSLVEVGNWIRREYPIIIMTELVFIVALVGWAYVRAHNPELNSTEKPMELAFINGVRNSETFPPKDPWLAGYAISYYYFGYVIVASLADLTTVPTTLAFNLAGALTFALTATGALSVGYNLVRSSGPLGRWRVGSPFAGVGTGMLAATFILLTGHLGTALVELPYRGYASDIPVAGAVMSDDYFNFWAVTDFHGDYFTQEFTEGGDFVGYRLYATGEIVSQPPTGYLALPDRDGDGIPNWDDDPPERSTFSFNAWRQSRIVSDTDLSGGIAGIAQPIAEVPLFSFMLADNHPHVLGLPYTLLMLGLATALALRANPLRPWEIVLYGVFVGGMIFLNAWDAVYLVIVVAAEALRRLLRNGTGALTGFRELGAVFTLQTRQENNVLLAGPVFIGLLALILLSGAFSPGVFPLLNFVLQIILVALLTVPVTLLLNWVTMDTDLSGVVRFGAYLGIVFAVAYYPWILTFTSQANGFFPNIIFPTRSPQYFLQFGMFALLLAPLIVMVALQARKRVNYMNVMAIVLAGLLLMLAVPLLSTAYIELSCPLDDDGVIPTGAAQNPACVARDSLFGNINNAGLSNLPDVVERRLTAVPTQAVMLAMLGVIAMRLFPRQPASDDPDRTIYNLSPTVAIALLFIAAGIVASLAPDLLYLRDNFDRRMNTVFKLYYQSWTLLSVGTAFAAYVILAGLPRRTDEPAHRPIRLQSDSLRVLYAGGLGALVFAGLLFPYFALSQQYLYNPGRVAARDCEGQFCQQEDAVTLDGVETLTGAWADHNRRGGGIPTWRLGEDELAVMDCMLEQEPRPNNAVLLEASGGGYDPALGRFATYTGIPTLLGWEGHQGQWRGEAFGEIAYSSGRLSDIHRLYELDAELWESQGKPIVEQYGIDYIVVGRAERNVYADNNGVPMPELFKFKELYDPVCQQGDTAVYRVSPE